ncbi:hypothetical protein FOA43_000644 [Brettanomyces nanus]|uniref:protein-tyrosine-phosphatase n=1 Tax=Eeniella nana TaxID=13502 RepID=A0A875S1R9_EENNA|nr:uncharacterized protein FOA43_000644 [Brettanomyces nanus]QPG73334.1 hypothetical protein FOA43_000644 [Brettanomyces nanus]
MSQTIHNDSNSDDDEVYRVLGGLYISSMKSLSTAVDLNTKYGIDSIISVQKEQIPLYYEHYHRLQVPVDDLDSENLFLQFRKVNSFIENVLHPKETQTSPGKVLVHCNAGRSRSVSFVVAYLMKKFNLTYKQALYAVQRRYPKAEEVRPNEGFVLQLQLYGECECCDDVKELDDKYPKYRAFRMSLLKRHNMLDNTEYKDIKDVGMERKNSAAYSLRCKKCRQVLATSKAVIPHTIPKDDDDKQKYFYRTAFWTKEVVGIEKASTECTHFFVEPLKWMKPELSKGNLDGRFDCFKCGCKVGGYDWPGSRCSCGRWMVPAIHLQKAKVDKVMANMSLSIKVEPKKKAAA